MIKMVVFDMAGTTVNENNIVYKTLRKVINKEGFEFTLSQVLAHGAGKEKRTAIKDIIASEAFQKDPSLIDKIYTSFEIELLAAYNSYEITPQPGAEELFAALRERNVRVVLNTGYNYKTATSILQKLNWQTGQQIDMLVTADDVLNNRPHPDMILLAIKKCNIQNAAEVIKVGDSAIDIEEGKNAGCGLTVGITTGAYTYEQLQAAKPDHIINHLSGLLPLL